MRAIAAVRRRRSRERRDVVARAVGAARVLMVTMARRGSPAGKWW
jgi:hypothetical protein